MDDNELIREIREAEQRERWQTRWQKLGNKIIVLSIVIVLGTAGVVTWQHWQQDRMEQASSSLLAGMLTMTEEQDPKKAETAFREALDKAGATDLSALARLWLGSTLLAQAKEEEAIATWQRAESGEETGLKAYRQFLGTLTAGGPYSPEVLSGPFRPSAQEMVALHMLETGDVSAAVTLLTELEADPATPPSLSQRTRLWIAALPEPEEPNAKGTE